QAEERIEPVGAARHQQRTVVEQTVAAAEDVAGGRRHRPHRQRDGVERPRVVDVVRRVQSRIVLVTGEIEDLPGRGQRRVNGHDLCADDRTTAVPQYEPASHVPSFASDRRGAEYARRRRGTQAKTVYARVVTGGSDSIRRPA